MIEGAEVYACTVFGVVAVVAFLAFVVWVIERAGEEIEDPDE